MVKKSKEVFYAVKVGRKPGIYTNLKECQEQVVGFKGGRCKKFKTVKKAENFIEGKKYKDIDLPPSSPPPTPDPISLSHPSVPIPNLEARQKIDYSSLTSHKTNPQSTKNGFWAVRVGRNPGIYTTWLQSRIEVDNFSNGQCLRFDTLDEAKEYMKPGKRPKKQINSNDSITSPSTSKKAQRFYAVRAGHQPGIYTSSEESKKQMNGYKNGICKKFLTLREAEIFMTGISISEPLNDQINANSLLSDSAIPPLKTSSNFQFSFKSNIPTSTSYSFSNCLNGSNNFSLSTSNPSTNYDENPFESQSSSFVPFFEDHKPSLKLNSTYRSLSETFTKSEEKKRKNLENQQNQERRRKKVRFKEEEKDLINDALQDKIPNSRIQASDQAFQSISSLKWNEFEQLPTLGLADGDVRKVPQGDERMMINTNLVLARSVKIETD